ncbi:MAG: sodium/solute symporter [Pirellulales bacterium]|nr:sodium/solute symporter [Pirellulales bacterium]
MELTELDIGIFIFYILLVLGIGVLASRSAAATKRDYFLAGDKLPWWMVGGSIIAANISSHHFVSIMGTAYFLGFSAMNIAWPAVFLGFFALLWIFLPFYLRNGFYTMPEFLDRRYGAAARLVYGILLLLTYVFVEIAAVLFLGALAIHTLVPSVGIGEAVVGLAVLTSLYTITGGLRAVVWTEMLQLLVLLCGGTILAVKTLWHPAVGGIHGLLERCNEWHLLLAPTNPDFPCTMFFGGLLCISVFYCAANQFIVQRCLAAKDEWHARMGVVAVNYLQVFLPAIYILPGIVAPLIIGRHLAKPDMVFPTLVQELLPSGLVGLVMAGLIAAIMSHLSGAVNSCTTIATVDFYLPYINRNATDRQAVRFGRITAAAIFALAMVWAMLMLGKQDKPVFLYLLNVYGVFTPGIAAMFLCGILWKRTTQAGALAAGLLTVPLTLFLDWLCGGIKIPYLSPPHLPEIIVKYLSPFLNRTGVAFWFCVLVCVIVSLFTTPRPSAELEGLIWNKESLRLPKEMRDRARGLRNPLLWWLVIFGFTVFLYIRFGFMTGIVE